MIGKSGFSILLLLLLLFFPFRAEASSLSLNGLWKFRTGDGLGWEKPAYDDHAWKKIQVPGYWDKQGYPGYRGYAWYRLRFHYAGRTDPLQALNLGLIYDLDQTFLNGKKIGQTGVFDPAPRIFYGAERLYVIPSQTLRPGENLLAIRIWHAPGLGNHNTGGFASNRVELGDCDELQQQTFFRDLWGMLIPCLFLLIGIYHLPMFLQRRQALENLWFFLLCLACSAYGLSRTQIFLQLIPDFTLLKEIEYISLALIPIFNLHFVHALFGIKKPRFMQGLMVVLVGFILTYLFAWSVRVNTLLLLWFYLFALPTLFYSIALMIRELFHKNEDALYLFLGLSLFALFAFLDMFGILGVFSKTKWLSSFSLTAMGFLWMILSMAICLANRFVRTHVALERKSHQLTSIVQSSQEMSSLLHVHRLFERLLALTMDLTGALRGFLFVQNPKSRVFELVAQHALDGSRIEGNALNTTVLRHSLEQDRIAFTEAPIAERLLPALAIPLQYQGETQGIVFLEDPAQAGPGDFEILEVLASQAAISSENARLYEMAITDGLTAAITHRHFQFLLQKEIERSARYQRDLSLLMIDIDFFKHFNDTYGHQAGDEVLRQIANTIQRCCRDYDTVARYGGEEFALILPETNLENAAMIAERVRQKVEQQIFAYEKRSLQATVSIGIATYPTHAFDREALIKAADQALYLSKSSGRNRITASPK